MRGSGRRLLSAGLLATAGVAVGMLGLPGAGAVTVFTAAGSASTYDVIYLQDSVPITQGGQFSGASVDSKLDSSGNGCSYASFPYPGEGVATLPDTASSLAPPPLNQVPPYPTYLATCTGQQPATLGQEGATFLRSANTDRRSEGRAAAGTGPGPTLAASSVTKVDPDGSVSVVSDARTDGLVVPGGVEVSGVRSRASALRSPGGAITLSSSLSVAEIVVAGQVFGFKDGQFFVAGTGTPVPAQDAFAALAGAGVKGSFTAAQRFGGNTVVAPSLRLEFPLPAGSLPSQTDATVVVNLGFTSAGILGEDFSDPTDGGGGPPPPPPTDSGGPPGGGVGGGEPPTFPPLAPGGGDQPPVAGPEPAPEPAPAGTTGVQPTAAGGANDGVGSFDIYPVLVAAALLVLAAAQAVRLLGVRFVWVS